MNIVGSIFLSLSILYLAGCSSKKVEVTSGQGGEAFVIGIARYKSGEVASGEKITIAPRNYSPFEDSGLLQETISDSSGSFSFDITEKGEYIIAARNDTSLLFEPYEHVLEDVKNNDLGEISFDKGAEVNVIPWWDLVADTSVLGIAGTPWTFDMEKNGLSPILLPKGEVGLIHSNGNSFDTLSEFITENSAVGAEITLEHLRLRLDDTLTYNTFFMQITNYSELNDYYIDWGDSTPLVKYESDIAIHTFADGFYIIRMYAQSKSDRNAISPLVEYGHTVQKPEFTK